MTNRRRWRHSAVAKPESLEPRLLLAAHLSSPGGLGDVDRAYSIDAAQFRESWSPNSVGLDSLLLAPATEAVFRPTIVGGTDVPLPTDPPIRPDSPHSRVDPNTPDGSRFAGVGSIKVEHQLGKFLCSGTVIHERFVLTAAHCFDVEATPDGRVDAEFERATFILNAGGDETSSHVVTRITTHPDFGGFSTSGANDDLAIMELATPVPAGTPIYEMRNSQMASGEELEFVGYGRAGFGDQGFTVLPAFDVKRTGKNAADLFAVDDEGSGVDEVYLFDFDEPTSMDSGFFGGFTLGNDIEASIGGGDSGGPAFVTFGNDLVIAGVNTFEFALEGTTPPPGFFGSIGGGIIIDSYLPWVQSIVPSGAKAESISQPIDFSIANTVLEGDAGTQVVRGSLSLLASAPAGIYTIETLDGEPGSSGGRGAVDLVPNGDVLGDDFDGVNATVQWDGATFSNPTVGVTITNGGTEVTLDIIVRGDRIVEGEQDFRVRVTPPDALEPIERVVTIDDENDTTEIRVGTPASSPTSGDANHILEGGESTDVTVTLSNPVEGKLTVAVDVSEGTALVEPPAAPANEGDYNDRNQAVVTLSHAGLPGGDPLSSVASFPVGGDLLAGTTVSTADSDDTIAEGNETIKLVLSGATHQNGGAVNTVDGQLTIVDNDTPSPPPNPTVLIGGSAWVVDHYSLREPGATENSLPWINLDRIEVRYDAPPAFSSVSLEGPVAGSFVPVSLHAFEELTNTVSYSFPILADGHYRLIVDQEVIIPAIDFTVLHSNISGSPGPHAVVFADFVELVRGFGQPVETTPSRADLDGDGQVDFSDFVRLVRHFGNALPARPAPAAAPVINAAVEAIFILDDDEDDAEDAT